MKSAAFIPTPYSIMRPHRAGAEQRTVDLPAEPSFAELSAVLCTADTLGEGAKFERVRIFSAEDTYLDMFVAENGALVPLPLNPQATIEYQRNVLTHDRTAKAGDLPGIYGVAVLFSRRVWF